MGKRGPLPDNVRSLKQSARVQKSGSTASNLHGLTVRAAPKAPTWLDREARAEWGRVVPELERLGLLTSLDRAVLAAYCDAWSRFCAARRALAKAGGAVIQGERGVRKHPAWQIYREALTACLQLWKELALTPNARLRTDAPTPSEPDAAADLLEW